MKQFIKYKVHITLAALMVNYTDFTQEVFSNTVCSNTT